MNEDYTEIMEDDEVMEDDEDYNWGAWTYYFSTYQEYKDFIDNYQNISKSENNYQIISFDDQKFHVSSLGNKNKAILF